MHEEHWVSKWLIDMKQCGLASRLHMKYSGSLSSKYIEMTEGRQAHLF